MLSADADGRLHYIPPVDRAEHEHAALARVGSGDGPAEVFALDTFYPGAGHGPVVELDVRRDGSELRWYERHADGSRQTDRYFSRPVSSEEVAALRAFVVSNGVDRLPPLKLDAWDGVEYHYFHAAPHAAYRVRINNPHADSGVYMAVVQQFDRLADGGRLRLHYTHRTLPPWAEILYASPEMEVRGVTARGGDVRVLVAPYRMTYPEWHAVVDGRLSAPVESPDGPAEIPGRRRPPGPYVKTWDEFAWVDESTARAYVITDGNLFRMPATKFTPSEWRWGPQRKRESMYGPPAARPGERRSDSVP